MYQTGALTPELLVNGGAGVNRTHIANGGCFTDSVHDHMRPPQAMGRCAPPGPSNPENHPSGRANAERLADQVGVEPTARGFGSRCSSGELLTYGRSGRSRTRIPSGSKPVAHPLSYRPMADVTGVEPAQNCLEHSRSVR